jgi:8-amino-7-oxononanoate synthase
MPQMEVDGQWCLSFSSNDYLGLANSYSVREALIQATRHYGVGSGASPLMNGYTQLQAELEQELALVTEREKALVFSNGYMANVGVLTTLVKPTDTIVLDFYNHASLIDAAQLTRASLRRYRHADPEALENVLRSHLKGRVFVVTDAVFSMAGNLAPLDAIAEVCRRYQATLIVDDAHGFGLLGASGQGTTSHFGLGQEDVPILVATFGKALGVYGAFVSGPRVEVDRILQGARTYVYSTALPPALAAATRVALNMALADQWRRDQVFALVDYFREQAVLLELPVLESKTPIQPYLLGESKLAIQFASDLQTAGIHVVPIRPPTVPSGMARLRISLTAAHSRTDIDHLLRALIAIRARNTNSLQHDGHDR